jgi:2-keto-4-pentenoate hydratase
MGVRTLPADAVDRAAAILETARHEVRRIASLPDDVRPRSLADAYAIADRLAERLGWPLAGWYCGCTNVTLQRRLGLGEPVYGRLFAPLVHRSPAVLSQAALTPVVLECEFGFRLSRDLPRRSAPYTQGEVSEAIATVHPCIEVVAGHLEDWIANYAFDGVADNAVDGGLVVGIGVPFHTDLNLRNVPVRLKIDGALAREGVGADVLGDPVAALTWLANARSRDGDGLRAGDLHNTGTATDIAPFAAGSVAEADFGPIGKAELALTP